MVDLPRGTVTFLFTDIESSTRLWEQFPQLMQGASARHDVLLHDAITAHNGAAYKVIGDALQVAFPTAPDAIAAAAAAQQALVAEQWMTPEPLRVRMALHTAAAEPDPGGDYRTPELNRLGRLLGAGHGGQVLLTLATAELARDRLLPGVSLQDLGEHRLTDLYRPEHIVQLVHPSLPSEFPALRTLESRPNNLPLQPTLLIGREREVEVIKTLMARDSVRLVTLTGPGGMGKTRLALQVAADLLAKLRDGVWFISLGTTSDPALVAETIAETLGLRYVQGRETPETIAAFLREKQALLVLDNFEQVVEAAPLVTGLLAACPALLVLVTSRVRLQLRGEHEIPVPPLDLPDSKQVSTPQLLSQYEAVRLFIERAQDVKPDFLVTNANVPAIAAICHRLDGSPLAIELAAARIRILPPAAMLARLEQRLSLLTGGARDLPERQRTLRGTIAWSYDLLGGTEQALFRQMAIFVGGCSLEAAETVAGGLDSLKRQEINTLDSLELLVAHNLVRQEEGADEPWFRMLETIREFGMEQLVAQGELYGAQERHASYYSRFAEEADAGLKGPDSGHWIRRMETEYDNCRAALAWADGHNASETSLRLRTTIFRFWITRGHTQRSD